MTRLLTTTERIELNDIFNAASSAAEAARIFNYRHPERTFPVHRSTAIRLANKLHERGSLLDINGRGRKSVLENVNVVNNILGRFRENQHTTIKKVSDELQHSTKTVVKVLKANGFRGYKFQKHQRLKLPDYNLRVNYCNNFIAQSEQDPHFYQNILWTDECLFTVDGCPNKQTYR